MRQGRSEPHRRNSGDTPAAPRRRGRAAGQQKGRIASQALDRALPDQVMRKEGQTHYICWCRLNNADAYLIWYSNATDGVVVDKSGDVLVFTAPEDLLNYAKAHDILIKEEAPQLHDLDVVDRWVHGKAAELPGCEEVLLVWNLLTDISSSLREDFEQGDDKTKQVYEKLFFGNNLPSITPDKMRYNPVWKKGELQLMRKTLKRGFEIFRRHMKVMEP